MEKKKSIKERFEEIAENEPSKWLEEAEWRITNRDWLDRSFEIAVRVLITIREKKITQKKLAEMMDVTPQHVSKIVRGKENLTLSTISKLEKALGISLISIPEFQTSKEILPIPILPINFNYELTKSKLTDSKNYEKTEQFSASENIYEKVA